MVPRNGPMRIFWPLDASTSAVPGVLVGFRNSERDVLVVAILHHVQWRRVESALAVGTLLHHSTRNAQELLQRCRHSSLHVLGCVNPDSPPSNAFDPRRLVAYTDAPSRFPRLYCPAETALTFQVILYERPYPTKMQYLSLAPMSLALGGRKDQQTRDHKAAMVDKLRLHTVIARTASPQDLALPAIIDQINCSFELRAVLLKNIGKVGPRPSRAMSVSERVTESVSSLWDCVSFSWACIGNFLYPMVANVIILAVLAHCSASELALGVLEWRPGSPESPALKDISATAQQVDLRLQQSCYWPVQYLTLRKRKANWESFTSSHPDYIRFYNSLWLVANDVIIGMALGSFIIENCAYVAMQVDTIFHTWSVEGLRRMIAWLMEWPGGLKLNTELAEFLGDLFLWVIDHWAGCLAILRPHMPTVIFFIGFSSFSGATLPISLFSDLVSLLTLHIYCFYVASARIFHWQLSIIISLFHLFRGKKRNVLRHRIDSCDYDLDQLLLGTILFTLLVFLLPTVLVFYLTFATARVAVILLKCVLEIGLACLNHFPLFAVMLRLKDPKRLPGGIRFELQDMRSTESLQDARMAPTAFIVLKSIPLSLRAMFDSYFELGSRIRKHYFSPGVILHLASGRFIPPIHRRTLYSLQYSMLPAHRPGLAELWTQLSERNREILKVNTKDSHGHG